MTNPRLNLVFGLLALAALSVVTLDSPVPAQIITREQIETDWLLQDKLRNAVFPAGGNVTCEQDAAGGCDGIVNGKWGFHTAYEENPWWQVDLGEAVRLQRIVVYNRCDLADRASRLVVLLSDDAKNFRGVYRHEGKIFRGYSDNKPLIIRLGGVDARYVRLQLPGKTYFHLDEVEIYAEDSNRNIALGRSAAQSSTSQWSISHFINNAGYNVDEVMDRGFKLANDLRQNGVEVSEYLKTLRSVAEQVKIVQQQSGRELYLRARRAARSMAFANPLLDFETILFVKRAPGTLPHMSDQYYGWWSRPGGGICLLERFKEENSRVCCLTTDWLKGNFLRPDLSYDGRKVLFAYCRYYPQVAGMDKVNKEKLPEDAFYHIFEMNMDGSQVKRLTYGRYDDFDARYLPNGDIVFLSTRKGQFVQCTKAGVTATTQTTLPDSYVRCGGDNIRPVPVYTLHAMDSDGRNIRPLSAFENFEWTPSVAHDGRILYARWDYIDRFNGHVMSLWSTNQDGTNPNLVYGNFTTKPQCIFEARSIPNSQKLIFTASAHHSITGGSLALLDCTRGTEGAAPITRLTPDVCFPEAEGSPAMYYANPYPLSENYYLVAWSGRKLPPHRGSRQVLDDDNPSNALGLYLYDAFGNLELIYRDENISSMYPIPVRTRKKPPVQPCNTDLDGKQQGCFLVQDVYRGLTGIKRGSIKELRIIGVPPKTQPHMNSPSLGVSKEDPGKFILGTVPVEKDGSAYFHVPSGVPVFFQALDSDGLTVQTMRSLTYLQPGQTLSCIGCHESRESTPAVAGRPLAARREPSKITPGPDGSWPLRFDHLVQPVLDKLCVSCHRADSTDEKARGFVLESGDSYENLMSFADKDLEKLAFERDRSEVGKCPASQSKLLAMLTQQGGHVGVNLDSDSFNRLVLWMDVYAQKQGAFSDDQEQELYALRRQLAPMLAE